MLHILWTFVLLLSTWTWEGCWDVFKHRHLANIPFFRSWVLMLHVASSSGRTHQHKMHHCFFSTWKQKHCGMYVHLSCLHWETFCEGVAAGSSAFWSLVGCQVYLTNVTDGLFVSQKRKLMCSTWHCAERTLGCLVFPLRTCTIAFLPSFSLFSTFEQGTILRYNSFHCLWWPIFYHEVCR